jgi:putative tricarboxylic transport membrane protein
MKLTLDKSIAAVFLVIAVVYGYTAFTYPLLPFERNMVFLPNTMPMALSVIAIILCLIVILGPRQTSTTDGSADDIDLSNLGNYNTGQAVALIVAMILYALALRPIGFLLSTTLFLFATGWILGERKPVIMIPIALIGTGIVWFLVQQALGIFLRPLPWFLS